MGLLNIALQTSKEAIRVAQLGLEVTANNIANANSPGYSRQRVQTVASVPTELRPGVFMGTGVKLDGIQRMVDEFLNSRIRDAVGDSASLALQRQSLEQVEGIYNELTDSDLSTRMNEFFSSLSDLENSPEQMALRQLVVSQATHLADTFRQLKQGLMDARETANGQYVSVVDNINALTEQVASLNQAIVRVEGGGIYRGSASQLRDQRDAALKQLADLVGIRTVEQTSGSVSVFAGSHLLVYDTTSFKLTTTTSVDRNLSVATAVFEQDGSRLEVTGGKLQGYQVSRDEIYSHNMDRLDTLAGALIWGINQLHSEGRGLEGFGNLTSVERVEDPDATLNATGLDFTPTNGTFQIRVTNRNTGQCDVAQVDVDLDGIGIDDSLNTLTTKINTALGSIGAPVVATVNADRSLTLRSSSPDVSFCFAQDSSHVLAALGMGTFFTGSNAGNIGVNNLVQSDLTAVATALTDASGDGGNAGRMISLREMRLPELNNLTLAEYYQSTISSNAIAASVTQSQSDTADVFLDTLESERESVSGVNLDEEAVNLMRYQRAFQAAAKVIQTLDEMLQAMLDMV